jgi:dihydroorotase
VKFDLGHGGSSLVLRNAVPAVRQGFYPDSISTDLHGLSMNQPLQDMPTTISKMMAAGMPLQAAIKASTQVPSEMIGHPELGNLSVGSEADVAVWQVMQGNFGFADAAGGSVQGKERLQVEVTLRAGQIVWNFNGRGTVPFEQLPKNYGVREGLDFVVPPKR